MVVIIKSAAIKGNNRVVSVVDGTRHLKKRSIILQSLSICRPDCFLNSKIFPRSSTLPIGTLLFPTQTTFSLTAYAVKVLFDFRLEQTPTSKSGNRCMYILHLQSPSGLEGPVPSFNEPSMNVKKPYLLYTDVAGRVPQNRLPLSIGIMNT